MNYKFAREPVNKIPVEDVIKELKRVAEFYEYIRFTRHEFDKIAYICKGTKVLSLFGTWDKALISTGLEFKERSIDRSFISEKELFNEMERIWKMLGHRPSKSEWEAAFPKYSYSTYKHRFNGWKNACIEFIKYQEGSLSPAKEEISSKINILKIKQKLKDSKNKRNIPLKLRLKVFERDNFCCIYCGKSPANNHGTNLHIDHIKPYSKRGETVLENLQTLCMECNLGKGNNG